MSFRNVKIYSYSSPVSLGDWCIIAISFEYQGVATTEELYASIGNNGFFGFDEILSASSMRTIKATPSWKKYYASVIIEITDAIDPAESPYDVYAKIGGEFTPIVENVIYIEGETDGYETLEIDITPAEGGYVTTNPASQEGIHTWYDGSTGRFPYGTNVQVTAFPYVGYEFDHWSDEIVGGVSYNNPAYVKAMTENRSVKAHFRTVEMPPECTIDEDCPTGYVCYGGLCVPEEAPEVTFVGDITNVSLKPGSTANQVRLLVSFTATALNWWDGFGWETRVTIIAVPYSASDRQNHIGAVGDRTNQELNLGTMAPGSYNVVANLEAKGMLGDWQPLDTRTFLVNIFESEEPPECTIDEDCPAGYVCYGGLCVPEEEVPPEGKKFPWLPVALIGGGAVLIIASTKPKKK